MENAEVDWEKLPTLCLFLVLDKLGVPSNLVRFGVVCKYWYSVFNNFLNSKRRSSPNLVPMLLIPTRMSNRVRQLCSLQAKTKIYNIELPKSHIKRSCGSTYGWLAAVDKNMAITLLNPFKDGVTIDLPEIEVPNPGYPYEYNEYDVHKVILSADPLSYPDSYVVVVIYSMRSRLAFYKSEEKSWIYLDKDLEAFTDVIFYKNLVYAIGTRSLIISFDVNHSLDNNLKPKVKILMSMRQGLEDYVDHAYLVELSQGNLFSIKKEIDVEEYHCCAHFTKSFKVFKLILDDQSGELLEEKEVKNIDGDVVFVGDNQTLAVSALDFPEAQPNSIYFTDDYFIYTTYKPFGPRDNGFFNMKDGKVGKHYRFRPWHKYLPPFIWIQPPVEFRLR
ncbi:PREDICTED: uncharacterized protein LOC108660458 [Theobroma cacao]|uniref:Uncharacterized protein LOC108660458 n=1 Tax=Theobroma cacao TaxID=3641 RepID=A0AB32VZK1_THECC|nr:PREDICTED: uncharacterized protein LOC108660458 [Theobroma cacao]